MAPSTPTEQEPPPESESERLSRELSEALAETDLPEPWALAGLCVVALYAALLQADWEERAGRERPPPRPETVCEHGFVARGLPGGAVALRCAMGDGR